MNKIKKIYKEKLRKEFTITLDAETMIMIYIAVSFHFSIIVYVVNKYLV